MVSQMDRSRSFRSFALAVLFLVLVSAGALAADASPKQPPLYVSPEMMQEVELLRQVNLAQFIDTLDPTVDSESAGIVAIYLRYSKAEQTDTSATLAALERYLARFALSPPARVHDTCLNSIIPHEKLVIVAFSLLDKKNPQALVTAKEILLGQTASTNLRYSALNYLRDSGIDDLILDTADVLLATGSAEFALDLASGATRLSTSTLALFEREASSPNKLHPGRLVGMLHNLGIVKNLHATRLSCRYAAANQDLSEIPLLKLIDAPIEELMENQEHLLLVLNSPDSTPRAKEIVQAALKRVDAASVSQK